MVVNDNVCLVNRQGLLESIANELGLTTNPLPRSCRRLRSLILQFKTSQRHCFQLCGLTFFGFFTARLAAGFAEDAPGLPAFGEVSGTIADAATGCTVSSTPSAFISFLMVSNRVFAPGFKAL